MSTVYITRGRKYHTDEKCPLMVGGEMLWDFDSEDWCHIAGSYRRTAPTAWYAAACGKLPCLGCVPDELRAFPPLHGQTFGHKPVSFFGGSLVCARCEQTASQSWIDEFDTPHYRSWSEPVPWPCTSAIVLGLVERGEDR